MKCQHFIFPNIACFTWRFHHGKVKEPGVRYKTAADVKKEPSEEIPPEGSFQPTLF